MKTIDVRFSAYEISLLKSVIGKKLTKYKCDPFMFSNSVYGIVGVSFDNISIAFTNIAEVTDYYGKTEDVAIFRVKETLYQNIDSYVQEQTMIENPVESIVSDVVLVNDHQQLFDNGEQSYDVYLTRGVIFKFKDGHELSLEKDIWLSEDIIIGKGYNLAESFTPTSEFCEGWSSPLHGECYREFISLNPNNA